MNDVTTDDGVRLRLRELGAGEQVVLVPSMSWLLDDLEPLVAGRTLVGYDTRGQGHSAAVDDDKIGFDRDVEDLEQVRESLGVERVDLLGWSYHGAVCLRYAFAHPQRVRRLLLIGPVAPRMQPHWRGYLDNFGKRLDAAALRRLEQHRRAGLRQSDPEAWCRAHFDLILRVYVADHARIDAMRSMPWVAPGDDPERVNRQTLKVFQAMGEYDWRAEMAGFSTPALILHGDRDPVPIAGSHEWIETLGHAKLVTIAGSGHLPWLERPDPFFAAATAFLDQPTR